MSGVASGTQFSLVSDGHGGTEIPRDDLSATLARPRSTPRSEQIDVGGADAAPNTAYTIDITGTIDLTTALLAINLESGSSLTIAGTNGSGGVEVQTLDGGDSQRGLFVYAGNVTVENLTIQNMSAVGGAGGGGDTGSGLGGGGGAGLGGGLFVTGSSDGVGGANVTLDNVSFINDAATGGAGGGGGGGKVRRRWRRRAGWQPEVLAVRPAVAAAAASAGRPAGLLLGNAGRRDHSGRTRRRHRLETRRQSAATAA